MPAEHVQGEGAAPQAGAPRVWINRAESKYMLSEQICSLYTTFVMAFLFSMKVKDLDGPWSAFAESKIYAIVRINMITIYM
jgi:hypothetical protein